ncbi:hypothetical protein DMN91_004791 [Ooceraea biroi]|uniref:Uncharacterized protein n=1 Tax=Ooceraea biroi TaxID=2015173 RepID=A0A026VUH0_OOCBI|nr:UPF0389 protein CG9231 [Ooceraea biroi]XP_011349757.1 UPF0389 protein CG9231 [Ooceraea biroi]XP_019889577.1 UPF0389 protein CG9231 [Ooceraea biroi]EZA47448.1 hypothetical protein X777_15575 [Ooceraea biroi]RLU22513.1 hypothetical protein DMN91_004791 [Ooceraea biroi]
MLSRQFLHGAQTRATVRWFTRSSISRDTSESNKTQASNQSKDENVVSGKRMHHVTDFDRKVLVWVKRYPSVAEVPQDITEETLLTARSKARIKASNYMIVVTLIGCLFAAFLGKKQVKEGDSLHKRRLDWYKEVTEKDK